MGKETTSGSILSAATHGAELTGAVFMEWEQTDHFMLDNNCTDCSIIFIRHSSIFVCILCIDSSTCCIHLLSYIFKD